MDIETGTEVVTNTEPLSLRETLEASFDAAEKSSTEADAGRARDEQGRFAKTEQQAGQAQQAAPEQEQQIEQPSEQMTKKELTTWKREMRPLQEKLSRGETLTQDEALKLAQYNIEREQNYATGISGYKAKAEEAREYVEAMQEFLPLLQQNGLKAGEWIRSLGQAQRVLAMGTPQEKISMFANLAQMYSIPLDAIAPAQQGQYDGATLQLMEKVQQLEANVNGVKTWREQEQQAAVQRELAKFSDASKYPHFERVRNTMAQLLETGMANDPDSAYERAVRLDDDAWNAEQQRQAAQQISAQTANKTAAAARARQASVSMKSGTPAGHVTSTANPGNLRGAIEAAFDTVSGNGRV